jgi:hypothetical protein
MGKRAVDLSLEELAVLGANAALRAAQKAQDAGLVVTGTVDFLEDGRPASSLAERHSSGAVTVLAAADTRGGSNKPEMSKPSTRPRSTD